MVETIIEVLREVLILNPNAPAAIREVLEKLEKRADYPGTDAAAEPFHFNEFDGTYHWFSGFARSSGLPSVIGLDGTCVWCDEGKPFRLTGPAIVRPDGYMEYHMCALGLHNPNGPAIVYPDGSYKYYYETRLHRIGGPALFIRNDTDHATGATGDRIEYYVEDKLHRIGGPARVVGTELVEYHVNGRRDRADGPAVVRPRGVVQYWRNGQLNSPNDATPAEIRANGDRLWYNNGKLVKHEKQA